MTHRTRPAAIGYVLFLLFMFITLFAGGMEHANASGGKGDQSLCPGKETKFDNMNQYTFTVPYFSHYDVTGLSVKAGKNEYWFDAKEGDVIDIRTVVKHKISHVHVCKEKKEWPTPVPTTPTTQPPETSTTSTTVPSTSTTSTPSTTTSTPSTTTTEPDTFTPPETSPPSTEPQPEPEAEVGGDPRPIHAEEKATPIEPVELDVLPFTGTRENLLVVLSFIAGALMGGGVSWLAVDSFYARNNKRSNK